MRSIPIATLLLVAACGSDSFVRGGRGGEGVLSFAQVQSIERGMSLAELEKRFGPPVSKLEGEGRVAAVAYRAENAQGGVEELRIAVDADGLVERWTLAERKS
ncbi:MAG: hypothetical protein AAGA81_12095 [Acidobacteriota bacterium]